MMTLTIAPSDGRKGRSFQSDLIAHVTADKLWAGGDAATDVKRPVWAVMASSDQQLRAFLANWTTGRKALGGNSTRGDKWELLKSAGYQSATQRFAEGAMATVYLPELFRADPGMVDPERVRFCMLPGKDWAAAQEIGDRDAVVKHCVRFFGLPVDVSLADLVPSAFLFAVYLDRRTRCPLVADGRFYLQLMLACLDEGLARRFGNDRSLEAYGLDAVGILSGAALAFNASQKDVETIVAREVERYFLLTKGEQ